MRRTICLLVSIILASASFASTLLGTKDLKYHFRSIGGFESNVYVLKDIHGNPLEEGIQLNRSDFEIKVSTFQKDNMLQGGVAGKISNWDKFPVWGQPATRKTTWAFFYLPSVFSADTSFQPKLSSAIVFDRLLTFGNKSSLAAANLDWQLGINYRVGVDPSNISPFGDSDSSSKAREAIFTYSLVKPFGNLSLRKPLPLQTNLLVSYSGFMQNAADVPFYLLKNYEGGLGLEHQNFKLVKYYPFTEEVKREQYPYEGERWQLEFNLPLPANFNFSGELVQKTSRVYSASLSRTFKNFDTGLFVAKDYLDRKIGLQISLGEETAQNIGNYYSRKETVPNSRSATVTTISLTNPPDVSGATTIDELAQIIDTPAKAVWYIGNEIEYNVPTNIMWQLRSPEEVFAEKKGYCTESAGLQSYLLTQNGYETKIVSFVASNGMHTICIFKDKATGKWVGIDNGAQKQFYYDAQADNIADFMGSVYPARLSYITKNSSGDPQDQFDSTTKWYLMDWLE